MRSILATLLIVTVGAFAVAADSNDPVAVEIVQVVHVPTTDGDPVLLDGLFRETVWDSAAYVVVNERTTLRFAQYRGHLFVGIDCPEVLAPVPDIYLAYDSSTLLQIHVSAQLGERVHFPHRPGFEAPRFVWGETYDWYANEFRWNSPLTDSLVRKAGQKWEEAMKTASFDSEGTEIQILRTKIPSDTLRFRLELGEGGQYDKPTIFPKETNLESIDDWLMLVLE